MQHKLNVAEVDCEQHKALCTSQGVAGFPTMFYYAHGAKTEYSGGRSYDQLVSFADKASNPYVTRSPSSSSCNSCLPIELCK